MSTTGKKIVFISYSWNDKSVAERVRESIPKLFDVWIDKERIRPGDSISKAIQDGLSGSDYYVLLISEQSNYSRWVQKEISTAFELANKKKLSVIPILLNNVEVPFEFKGLLYIDFRQSVARPSDCARRVRAATISCTSRCSRSGFAPPSANS